MKKRIIKLIVCFAVISCLMIGFCTAFASAEPAWLIRAKAGVSAAMLAAQLVINPINVALDSPLTQAIDPEGRIEWVETLPEYLERSKIRVYPDVVTIDGVPYTDIWLGPDAANNLRLKGLDFASAYNILNNQSSPISYASGYGYLDGVPLYSIDGVIRSPYYMAGSAGSYSLGNSSYDIQDTSNPVNKYLIFYYDGVRRAGTDVRNSQYPFRLFIENRNYYYQASNLNGGFWNKTQIYTSPNNIDVSPFSFDYTSGEIDAIPDPEDGLLMRVPSSYTDPDSSHTTYNYDIHDLININPTVTSPTGTTIEIDPDLNPDFQTDIDLGNGVGDIIWKILALLDLLDNIDIEFAPEPDSPSPDPQPGTIDPLPDPDPAPDVPSSGTTIANTDWTKLDEILRWIQSTIDSIRHLTESLQTMLDSIFDAIQSVIQHISEIPEVIRELADKILEDIELGPAKLFDKALDILKTLFLPLLLPIRAMMNLWHYVVEWIQSISIPFTWIFGIMSGTSGNLVLPIYALLAGGICISIYKALGR